MKIIVELLLTLALVTKQIKQGRFSEFVLVGKMLNSLQDRENGDEASGRKRDRGSPPEAG